MKTFNIAKTKLPKYLYLIISIIIIVTFNNCDNKKSSHVLRIGHVLDTNSPVHKAMVYLGENLDKYSNGTLKITVYPSSQLGNERESLELLQVGSLDIAKVSSAVLENFVPEMGVYSLPYLFRDSDHLWKSLNSDIGKELLLRGEQFWLRGLCYYDAGFRSFFLKEKLVDDVIITVTPYLVGGNTATTLVDGIGFSKIIGSTRLKLKNIRKVKNEIILHYQRA